MKKSVKSIQSDIIRKKPIELFIWFFSVENEIQTQIKPNYP